MNLTLKSYKLSKIKLIFENNSLVLISNITDTNNQNDYLTSQKNYLIRIKLLKKLLKRSLLCNLSTSINGMVVLTIIKSDNLNISSLLKTTTLFIGLKLNKNFYSENQIKTVKTLNYNKTIKNFHGLLNSHLTYNSLKLKNFRNNVI